MPDLSERLNAALTGRYRLERELGRGGMATVFLAEDLRHHRPVAIKVLDPQLASAIGPERFLREIDTVAGLTHPNILPLFDSGEAAGSLFYVMPYVAGRSLRQRLDSEKQLPVDDALRFTAEVADALDHAHRQGIVHRDIKPENILIEEGHAVVADFGIARALWAAGADQLTATGFVIGTPAYMSPEQAAGSRELSGRSDVYALGCVLYEMLAGQAPFTGPTAESLVHQHLNVRPHPVAELRPTVPGIVSAALQRALAKTPADRFATTGEFAAACVRGESSGGPPSALAETVAVTGPNAPAAKSHARPAPRLVVATTVAAVVIVAVGAWQYWGGLPGLFGGRAATTSMKKDLILVADFDGPPDDPSLARATRALVAAALDQSTVVGSVPREQIREALERAGKPDTVRLTLDLAREIAIRSAVRAVLAGEVTRLANRYTVSLRVTDVEEDQQVLTLTDVARSQDDLIPVLTRMGVRVSQRLGASPGLIRTTHESDWPAATPSFEAYRRFVEAGRLYDDGDFAGALPLFCEAASLDPAFGGAWGGVAWCHHNLGDLDSALVALHEAMRHPRSITPAYRLYLEGVDAMWQGDARRASETFERVARVYPRAYETAFAFNNWQGILFAEGRVAAAYDVARIEDSLGFGPTTHLELAHRTNLFLVMGRLEDARATAAGLRESGRLGAEFNIALASANWDRATGLLDSIGPAGGGVFPNVASLASAQVAAARGEVSGAMSQLLAAETRSRVRSGATLNTARLQRVRVLLALMSGRPVPRPEPWLASDTTTTALITRGYMAAAAGETTLAQQLLTRLRARSTTRLGAHGSTPEFLEALLAARAGQWNDVVRLAGPPARDGTDHGYTIFPIGDRIGSPAERWLAAQAHERLNQPDSAAAFYLRMLAPDHPSWGLIGLVHLFAHQRLAVLEARMGRIEEAQRHLAILERDVKRPDPDVRRLLDEARAAVRGAPRIASAGAAGR